MGLDANQLKLNWLKSLSCPSVDECKNRALDDSRSGGVDPGWVIGVDPDLSGALAVLRPDNSAQVLVQLAEVESAGNANPNLVFVKCE